MDIAEAARYHVRVGAEHDVDMSRDWSDACLVWIELRVELPNDVFSVIVNREAHQPVQIKNACHQDE
jgi:hypothetical protein